MEYGCFIHVSDVYETPNKTVLEYALRGIAGGMVYPYDGYVYDDYRGVIVYCGRKHELRSMVEKIQNRCESLDIQTEIKYFEKHWSLF